MDRRRKHSSWTIGKVGERENFKETLFIWMDIEPLFLTDHLYLGDGGAMRITLKDGL